MISIGTIGLIKGVSSYRADKGVRLATYCSRCIENEILMYFRGMKKSAGDLSLSDSIDTDKEGNSISLMDVVSSDADMLEEITGGETKERLKRYIMSALDEREREIISLRYGFDGGEGRTQRETAKICGISRSYVSRIEKKALEKLKAAFENEEV